MLLCLYRWFLFPYRDLRFLYKGVVWMVTEVFLCMLTQTVKTAVVCKGVDLLTNVGPFLYR